MSLTDRVCQIAYYIVTALSLLLLSPILIVGSPIILPVWLLLKSIERDKARATRDALQGAEQFDPPPIHQSAHFASDAELEAGGCFDGGIHLGFSQESGREITTPEFVNQIVFGMPGSGKSTNKLMMQMMLWFYSMIIIDSTGELAAVTAEHRSKFTNVLLINPQRRYQKQLGKFKHVGVNVLSPNWINPRDEDQLVIRSQKEANGVIRREDIRNRYWGDTARELATNEIMTECRYSPNPSIVNVANVLRGDLITYARNMVETGDPWLGKVWGRYGRPGAEQLKSLGEVQEHCRTELWPFAMVPSTARCLEQDDVDFRTCLFEPTTIYVIGSLDTVQETGRFMRLIASHATAQIQSLAGEAPGRCMLVIDEGYNVGHIEEMDANLIGNRKFKLHLCLCYGGIQEVMALYPETWKSMLGACGVKQFFNGPTQFDIETAQHISRECGEREVVTRGRTVSRNPIYGQSPKGMDKFGVSDSKTISTRPLLLPHEARSLGLREQIMWVPNVNNPVRCDRASYRDIPALAAAASPNPFYES